MRQLCKVLGLTDATLDIFLDTHTPIEVFDTKAHTILVNAAWTRMTGFSVTPGTCESLISHRQPTPPSSVHDAMLRALKQGTPWQGTHMACRRDGTTYPQQTSLVPLTDAHGNHHFTLSHQTDLSHVGIDIAAEMRREDRSQMSRERFRALMDACQDAILISDWHTARFVDVNRAATDLFGYTTEEFRQLCGRDVIHPTHAASVDELTRQVRETGVAKSSTLLHRRKSGDGLWGELTLARFGTMFEDGIVAILRDVTERVERERQLARTIENLRERNILFQVAFQDSPVGLAMSASDGLLSSVNPAFCNMLGYTETELLGRSVRTLTHPADVATEARNARRLIDRQIAHYALEKRFLHKSGHPVYVAMTIARADIKEETIYIAQLIDVSEARQAREQLARASHLAALGRMAAAVAHDVNNPAAYLQLNLAEIRRQVEANELGPEDRADILAMLEDCTNGVNRISDIVRELQVFGTDIDTSPRPTDLAEVIRISARLAAHEVKHHAELVLDLQAVPMVVAQPSKLGRVITNLVLNAARAIGTSDPRTNEIRIRCFEEASHIVVSVSDTGPGLPADRDDLFEPFVRGNKSRGQGLGLWICAEIIRQHGGNITAQNVPGSGACFTFKLPRGEDDPSQAPSGLSQTHRLQLLVIDDEPEVLDAIYRSMRHHHHITIETDPMNALARLEQGEAADLVISDLMMPKMTGWEFQEKLWKIEPALAAAMVFISGGAIGSEASQFLQESTSKLVTKPFLIDDLLLAIEHARMEKLAFEQSRR